MNRLKDRSSYCSRSSHSCSSGPSFGPAQFSAIPVLSWQYPRSHQQENHHNADEHQSDWMITQSFVSLAVFPSPKSVLGRKRAEWHSGGTLPILHCPLENRFAEGDLQSASFASPWFSSCSHPKQEYCWKEWIHHSQNTDTLDHIHSTDNRMYLCSSVVFIPTPIEAENVHAWVHITPIERWHVN